MRFLIFPNFYYINGSMSNVGGSAANMIKM